MARPPHACLSIRRLSVLGLLAAVCLLAPVAACKPSAPAGQGKAEVPPKVGYKEGLLAPVSEEQDPAIQEAAEFAALLKQTVNASSNSQVAQWSDEGGPATVHIFHGVAVISQTPEGHRKAAELMQILQQAGAIRAETSDALPRDSELQARTRRRLAQKIDLDAEKARLPAVLDLIGQKASVQIVVDPRVLAEGIDLATLPINLTASQKPVDWILDQILPTTMGYQVKEGFILVTTCTRLRENLPLGLYRMASKDGRPLGKATDSPQEVPELIQIICQNVNAVSHPRVAQWSDEGGPGVLYPFNGAFVVTQTPEAQALIESLLRRLAEKGALGAGSGEAITAAPEPPEVAALRRTLAEPVDVDFEDAPLTDVLQRLTRLKPALAIQVDPSVTNDGVDPALRKVTLQLKQAPVGAILDLALGSDLTYKITPFGLQIMTRDKAYRNLPLVAYKVKAP
jgi:hypothetical protein